ncbi:MAG: hypothetical protein U0T56_04375 [Ferruginibacter sp.]|jgi:hypothetical protein
MRQKKEIILLGTFILLFLVLLAGMAGMASTSTTPEPRETCLPNTPCTVNPGKPVQEYHWNPVSRGVLHI